MLHQEVLGFINRFTHSGARQEVIDCFRYGCCYWFAEILQKRFHGTVVYDVVANHFGCEVGDRVYDITGDVTGQYEWVWWISYSVTDTSHAQRIEKACIRF